MVLFISIFPPSIIRTSGQLQVTLRSSKSVTERKRWTCLTVHWLILHFAELSITCGPTVSLNCIEFASRELTIVHIKMRERKAVSLGVTITKCATMDAETRTRQNSNTRSSLFVSRVSPDHSLALHVQLVSTNSST